MIVLSKSYVNTDKGEYELNTDTTGKGTSDMLVFNESNVEVESTPDARNFVLQTVKKL